MNNQMKATRHRQNILLSFNPLERRILHPILQSIHSNYQRNPDNFPAREKNVWYSSRGCQTAGLSAEETRDWIRSLHENRLSHLSLLQSWITLLDPDSGPDAFANLDLAPLQAPAFLAILNDHRLLCHARHDLGQEDLIYPLLDDFHQLTPAQRAARAEIDLLAHIMEIVLRLIPNSGADWQNTAGDLPW